MHDKLYIPITHSYSADTNRKKIPGLACNFPTLWVTGVLILRLKMHIKTENNFEDGYQWTLEHMATCYLHE